MPWTLSLLMLAVGGALPVRAQPVQGDVRSVGFQAAVASRFVIRYGQWSPILVELTAQGSQPHEVELRCELADLDGDRVVYVEPHVVVTPEAGLKRVWCYAASVKEDAGRSVKLDVIDHSDGALLTTLQLPAFESISNDTQLILDISGKRVTGLDTLDSGAMSYNELNPGNRAYYRSICVASLPAKDLPDRWYGLEAADVIVWDEPDPESLSIPQLAALLEWVRNGGQLVIGIGPAWTKIQKSVLAEIMPLKGTRPAVEVRRLTTFPRQYARSVAQGFKAPISVALGEPAPGALVTFRDRVPGLGGTRVDLVAMKCVGSGRVIATAARLRDLTDPGLSVSRKFYRELLDLNRNESEFLTNEGKVFVHNVASLYEPLIAQIEFRRLATARVLAAFAFVAAYILLSTFGAWSWLKRHTLTHVSWTAFALFAVIASLLSLGAVGLTRGVTGTVHSFGFVDLAAGSSQARATTYFGYKSNRRQRVDVSLPGEGNYLRPLATGRAVSGSYATPERYSAVTDKAALAGTPMRATLKQFEGVWLGRLEGSIRGSLTAERGSGKLTPQSWLQNDLDVEFTGGYLLYIDPRLRGHDGGVPYRVAGLNTRNDRPDQENKYYGSDTVPPAVNVLAVALPKLEPGRKLVGLGAGQYAQYDRKRSDWLGRRQRDPMKEPMLPTLRYRQLAEWIASSGVLGGALDQSAAGLLASTRHLYLHNGRVTDFDSVGRPVTTAGLVDQDVTDWLTRGQAVLLLLSDQPGPAQLHLNGEPKENKEGRCIYRVRIPIRYSGSPPRGNTP